MRYQTEDGKRFTLAAHTPVEWAEIVRKRLVELGCSRGYAVAEARRIATAEKVSDS